MTYKRQPAAHTQQVNPSPPPPPAYYKVNKLYIQ